MLIILKLIFNINLAFNYSTGCNICSIQLYNKPTMSNTYRYFHELLWLFVFAARKTNARHNFAVGIPIDLTFRFEPLIFVIMSIQPFISVKYRRNFRIGVQVATLSTNI